MNAQPESSETENKPKPIPFSRLPRIFLSRRWILATLLVVVGMAVTFRLGIWQLDRLEQRKAENALYLERINAPALVLDGSALPGSPSELKDRNATAGGQFDFAKQIVLVQQNYQGRPGGHLVAPFLVDGSDVAILVDRGWVPAHEIEAGSIDQFSNPEQVEVAGSLQPSQILTGGRQTEVEGYQQEWYRIDIESLQRQMPYELMPVYLLEDPPAEIQEELPFRERTEIDLSNGPHLSYAIQWFSFCLMLAIGYIYFVRTRGNR